MGNSPRAAAAATSSPQRYSGEQFSPQHHHQGGRGYQDQPDGGPSGYMQDRRQGFQDFPGPGGEEEQPPQISADLSDIARLDGGECVW